MIDQHSEQAALIILHHDILAPGDSEVADDGTIPPTRSEIGYRYRLNNLPCTIGRDLACSVRVRAHRTDISREHVRIEYDGAHYILRDRSRHGAFVNGQRVIGFCQLDTGDVIGLASTEEMLRFVDPKQIIVALTVREIEILQEMASGRQKKEVAHALTISLNTVNTHVKNIYGKLGASNVVEAVNQARKLGLLE